MDLTELIKIENNLIENDNIFLSEFNIIKLLKSTYTSEIYLVKKNYSNYILKIYNHNNKNELNVIKRLKNNIENIPILYKYHIGYYKIYLVYEYIENNITLTEFINNYNNISEGQIKNIFKNLINIVYKLHDNNIIHGDISPDNILLKYSNNFYINEITNLYLIDFSCSNYCIKNKYLNCNQGTNGFIAPEINKKRKYNEKADIYSIGIILYILISGYHPFYKKKMYTKLQFNNNWNPEAKDLTEKLLELEPNKRLKSSDILNHSWLKKN